MHTQTEFKVGDWVQVKPEHDIPPQFRGGKPTVGKIIDLYDDPTPDAGPPYAGVAVPIGDADVDDHSQYVPYELAWLELRAPADVS